jgi:hypothetical protein
MRARATQRGIDVAARLIAAPASEKISSPFVIVAAARSGVSACLTPGNRLDRPVDDEVDHVLGPSDAAITLVEYGRYACPHCRAANERIAGSARSVRRPHGRHKPRNRSRMVSPRGASTRVASDRPPASFLWNRVVGAPASVKLAGQYETPILSVINAFETV